MATATTITGRGGRFGRTVRRLAAAGVLVLLALGATLGAAGASDQTVPITSTREEFIDKCRAEGGFAFGSAAKNEATCTKVNGDGTYTETRCDFTFWYCTVSTRPMGFYPGQQSTATHGEVGGGVAADDGEASGGQEPIVVTRGTAKPGTILVLDDDEQP